MSEDDPEFMDENDLNEVRSKDDPRFNETITSNIEFQIKTTNPQYGKKISPEVDAELSKTDGDKRLWDRLALIYTRDYRLGNYKDKELDFIRPYGILCDDLILDELFPAGISIAAPMRVIGEGSQGRGGFLRKINRSKITRSEFSEDKKPGWGEGVK